MLETILEYWVVWACGLIAAALGFMTRRWIKLENKNVLDIRKKDEEQLRKDITEKLENEIKIEVQKSNEADVAIRADIEILENNLENLTKGVLAIQGKEFKQECRDLLDANHVITVEEYEQVVEDHEAYHALGGNHRGDSLFNSVEQKWNGQLNN